MEIVINISNETYENFMDDWTETTALLQAVRHGTVLPEHGDLIDRSKLQQDIYDDDMSWQYPDDECPYEGYSLKQIKSAPTIIVGSESE